jgi:hypothetical protein
LACARSNSSWPKNGMTVAAFALFHAMIASSEAWGAPLVAR